jgi:16S rRNA (guanine527-N7)-methyltransferase
MSAEALAPAVRARLDALLDRHELPAKTAELLGAILNIVETDEHAPTTVRESAIAVDVHIADALVALEVDAVRAARRVVDLGAGAGIPGLPLAAALPGAAFALVESQSRKCAFIERARAAAGLANVEVVCERVEQWPAGIAAHDLALARAVAAAPVVLEYAAPLLQVGGTLVEWRGRRDPEQERQAAAAAAELGLALREIRRVQPFAAATDHHLHAYVKVSPTPDRFPRRPGIARKRPLGAPRATGALPEGDQR